MIRKLHVQNFRMLRSCSFDLSRARYLAGAAACGKTTVLSALQFVSDIVARGASQATRTLAPSIADLAFEPSRPVAFAVELVPSEPRKPVARFELELSIDPSKPARISREQLFLTDTAAMLDEPPPVQQLLFEPDPAEQSIVHERTPRGWRKVVAKSGEARDYFYDEHTDWHNMLRFGPDRSALGSLPEDPERFPSALEARDFLRDRVRTVALDPRVLKAPAAPGSPALLGNDGANLPCAVLELQRTSPERFTRWLEGLRMAVPSFIDASVREREADRHLVLEARFDGSREAPVPSWCMSDSVLRLMALSLLPYQLTGRDELLLIDEPEAGLHPRGVHRAYETLGAISSPAQLLCATSSALLTGRAAHEEVLVLRRGDDGGCEVLQGDQLPPKSSWLES